MAANEGAGICEHGAYTQLHRALLRRECCSGSAVLCCGSSTGALAEQTERQLAAVVMGGGGRLEELCARLRSKQQVRRRRKQLPQRPRRTGQPSSAAVHLAPRATPSHRRHEEKGRSRTGSL